MNFLFFEDLNVGDSWTTPSRTVTEADVVMFAAMTGDYDPLHVDHEYAKNSPYGKPIAHGLLGLAWLAGLGSQNPPVRTVAFVCIERWEFRHPVFIGDTVHAVNRITAKRDAGRRHGHVTWRRELLNQSGSCVQSGTFETLVALKNARPRRSRSSSPDAPRSMDASINAADDPAEPT
jgi:3-hydroxybutyryl-CoA dehydratase